MRLGAVSFAALPLASSPVAAQFGPIGGGGGSAPPSPSLNGPGYGPGPFYLPPGVVGRSVTGAAVATITTAYCSVAWFGNIPPTGGTGTLGNVGFDALAAGTTTLQAAIYANDATIFPNRPGALLGSSSAAATTSGQPIVTFSPGVPIAANSLVWICLQAGDTTFKYGPMLGNAAGVESPYLQYVGTGPSTFGSGGIVPPNGVSTSTGITAYGTWPATFHGATFAETTQAPWAGFSFSSVP